MELFKEKKFQYLLVALLSVLPLEALSLFSIHLPWFVEYPFFTILMVLFGRQVFKSGIESLFHLNFSNINLLMTIGVTGAIYLGQLEEAVIIVILFAVAEVLEEFGIKRSQQALEDLVDKAPKTAQLIGKEEKTPIEDINIGDIIIVKPGDQVPLDGKVVRGMSLIDEATITGEPLPKSKNTGDSVYAGTLNGSGYLEIEVTKTAKDTTLAKIIDLTYKAGEQKSKSQRFIETFAARYTPAVIVIALLLVVIPVFVMGQPFNKWFAQAITLLVIACPCALVIATPISIFSSIGNANKRGMLVKGGKYIEDIGKIKAIAFDKTRTLTEGKPEVSDIIPFNGFSKEDVIACASGLETFSEHPLAKSVLEKAKELKLVPHNAQNFEAVMGKGIKGNCAICADKHVCLGTLSFISQEHKISKKYTQEIEELEKQGKTMIVVYEGNDVKGIIGITDAIKKQGATTIKQLLKLGVTPIILTGDHFSAASFVAKELGIEKVKAGLLPEDKVKEVTLLLKEYKTIAMTGDGVNDAPALATSTVGIAMGAAGSDAAIENADIAIMDDDIGKIPGLINLGKTTYNTIRINIAAAIGTKALFLILAILGMSNLTLAIFADVGVTVLVVLYGLRLYSHQEYTKGQFSS